MRLGGSLLLLALVTLGPASPGDVLAQCLLANPSFEVPGSSGTTFGGWSQFGSVGSSTTATHGHVAARVSGPNSGGWAVSGVWQNLDTAPGQRWVASVKVWHSPSRPLRGQSSAILNIEWRNASGELISYESHPVADPSTTPGEVRLVSVASQAAPAGAAAVHFLLGVLQGPGDPVPDVFYDEATCEHLGPPTVDALQWLEFPGQRALMFGGRAWRVKGPGFFGPGPNSFCDGSSSVWVDVDGRLHLTIRRLAGTWCSSEVALVDSLGYGDYVFTTVGRLDLLDPAVVLGLFVWEYRRCFDPANGWWNPHNEVDVEFSRWGDPANDVAQFVAQPFNYPGNIRRFAASFAPGERVSHALRWLSDRVEFRSWRGGPLDESASSLIHAWTYSGIDLPRPEQPRAHMNLWQFSGPPANDQEVVIEAFTFVPSGVVAVAPETPRPALAVSLSPARPNPFQGHTVIGYALPGTARVDIGIFDLAGRRVRTLVDAVVPGGVHEAIWDARDDAGRFVSPGVFLARLQAGETVVCRRTVLIR